MLTTISRIQFAKGIGVDPIPVVQGDSGRVIIFELLDYTIPSGATATYYIQKPSGNAVYNTATISNGNINVELTAQALAEHGECPLQVRLSKDGEYLTSFDVVLIVRPFRGIDAVESTTEMNIFDQEVENVKDEIATLIPIKPGTGNQSIRAGDYDNNMANGINSFASGSGTTASGKQSFACGKNTTASGAQSHAEGYETTAASGQGHAEGSGTTVESTAGAGHAEGKNTVVKGWYGHAEGNGTISKFQAQHVFGKFNLEDDSSSTSASSFGTYVEIVGNGTNLLTRSNARTLDWNGNEVLAGKLTVGEEPENDMDVTTKGYVDGLFWTAVDENDDGNVVITFGGAG